MPTVQIFKDNGKCLEIDTSQKREDVYKMVRETLEAWTDKLLTERPITERGEMLLGLRPYPKREDKKTEEKPEEKTD